MGSVLTSTPGFLRNSPPVLAVVAGSVTLGVGVALAGPLRASLGAGLVLAPLLLAMTPIASARRALLILLFLLFAIGREFTHTHVGPAYILDVALVGLLVVGLRDIPEAFRRSSGFFLVIGGIVGWTSVELAWAAPSVEAFRESVLGSYSLWAVIGVIAARDAFFARSLARVAWWGGIPATACLLASASGHFAFLGVIPVAASVYVAIAMLVPILAPEAAPTGPWVKVVVVCEGLVLLDGEVRSVWVAFPVGLLFAIWIVTQSRDRLRLSASRVVVLTGVFAIGLYSIGTLAAPSKTSALEAEARSIVSSNGSSPSDANAAGRLRFWRYAEREVEKHPIAGIGFGKPQMPLDVCGSACSNDPTKAYIHNSWLAMALRLGLVGFGLLILFQAIVVSAGVSLSRSGDSLVLWLMACQIIVGVTALTAVVLEEPYLGSLFWLFGGVVVGRASLCSTLPALRSAVA